MRNALLSAFLLLTLHACHRSEPAGESHRSADPVIPVAVATARDRSLTRQRRVVGKLIADREFHIYSEIDGKILSMPYREGDKVRAGDIVVSLDDELIRAELSKARAQRRQTEADLTRQERLFERKGTSEDEVARAHTAVALARAEEALQRTLLSRAEIRAPFNAVISARFNEPGDVVPRHTRLLTLFDPGKISVSTGVSELLIPKLRPGDPVEVQIDALGETVFPGRISRVFPVIDPEALQGTIEVELSPPPPGARPGQLARVTLTSPPRNALAVPFGAVRKDGDGAYVYRIGEDDKAHRVAIRTGDQYGSLITVEDGLQPGDRVVVRGLLRMRDGRKVKVVQENDAHTMQGPREAAAGS
ncbi:MAG: efflux RND transporter periplasmic adaptor subunit [Gammaproteobacteria bacterium]|jgi:membrane fusion protein (multidrug efflux system)|nr:efflux RND transporter periplasmic adaptor subunit [Gammaproteobacteria bacterium]